MQGERRTSRSRNTSSYFCPYRASRFRLLITQGAALGYGIHWAFSPFKLNPKLDLVIGIASPCKSQNVAEAIRSVEKAAFMV